MKRNQRNKRLSLEITKLGAQMKRNEMNRERK